VFIDVSVDAVQNMQHEKPRTAALWAAVIQVDDTRQLLQG
jgi:hypothetical protein